VGTLGFAGFLAAMTAGRWFGPWALDTYGRVPVIRALTGVAVVRLRALTVGAVVVLVMFCFGPSTPVAFAGTLLWGAGISLGFPVGMSAGADDPARAASRDSVVSSLGYSERLSR